MAETRAEIAAGAAVLVAAAAFLAYAAQVTGAGTGRGDTYPLTASFRSAEGVTVGTDVRLAGVKVGSVVAMELNPQTFRADTRFAIREGIVLPEDSAVAVASEGLLGGNFIELLPGGSPFDLPEGSEIEDTQSAVSLLHLLIRYVGGGGEE
jgi:phospholipid/cholesterol/gamma-HCH transport system substrate-binding protein